MSKGDRVEIYGMSETSSRMTLKKTMETFGEVIGCHIGNRGVDWPVVRFQQPASAEAAVAALQNKQVWLDGVVLSGDWKGAKPPNPPKQTGMMGRSTAYDEDARELTSRELFMEARKGSGRDRDQDKEKDKDKEKDRDRRRRSRSRRRRD
eukprot:TRINITY_DN48079_c0_g1_i1.p1 TRINITY_DN48079_c0_g1~~TRINITY_DN48079_c0_g1_i1.p1  ORF type:complete len:150 (-),score=32.45 TRINITY_DN48079_c0_g1_i1:68-517(-)